MPEAGVKTTAVRVELLSCPGGYVELRQLSYDELLERTDGAMQVTQQMGIKDAQAQIRFANRWSNMFTFPRCIVDHNLTFDGAPIDFSKPAVAFKQLDPKVGREIEKAIDDLNQEDQAESDFTIVPSSSSLDTPNEPNGNSDETS